MPRMLRSLLVLIIVLVSTQRAHSQVDTVLQELNAYWAEMARTLSEGDFEGMQSLYHPDAIWEGGSGDSLTISLESEPLLAFKPFLEEVRAGNRRAGIEFRFSSRNYDENTAHEIGVMRSHDEPEGQERTYRYWRLDSYLVKKGTWMMLIENQTNFVLTESDWTALE